MARNTKKQEKKAEVVKDKNTQESRLVTKESVCSTFALFSFLAFLILCTRSSVFGDLGLAVHAFLVGAFGYLAYPLMLATMFLSIAGLFGKRLFKSRARAVYVTLMVICLSLVAHFALTFSWERTNYVAKCFYAGENFPACTIAGGLGGLIVFWVSAVMSNLGTIVFLTLMTAFFGYLCYVSLQLHPRVKSPKKEKAVRSPESVAEMEVAFQAEMRNPEPIIEPIVEQRPMVRLSEKNPSTYSPFGGAEIAPEDGAMNSREFLFGGDPAENFKRNLLFDPTSSANKRNSEGVRSSYTPSYTEAYQNSVNQETESERPQMLFDDRTEMQDSYADYGKTDGEFTPLSYQEEEKPASQTLQYPTYEEKPLFTEEEPAMESYGFQAREAELTTESFGFRSTEEEPKAESFGFRSTEETPVEREENSGYNYRGLFSASNPRLFEESEERNPFEKAESGRGTEFPSRSVAEESRTDALHIFDEENDREDPYSLRSEGNFDRSRDRGAETWYSGRDAGLDTRGMGGDRDLGDRTSREELISLETERRVAPIPVEEPKKPRIIRPYKRVPLDDFDCRDIEPEQDDYEVEETKQNIIATLEDFKVTGASIASVSFGPTVTRYNVALPRSISPKKIVALDQSIALSLHSVGVNIYPNYKDGVVSIEVPNKQRQFVQLGSMLAGDTFVNASPSSLMFTMGKNVANAKVYGDISKMIHMLVAGSSGSGKSVFLGSLIISMIYKYSPEELRLILIDPKKTEFVLYNNLPHLMINEIITDVNKAVQSLNWAIGEMNRRYSLFEQMSLSGKYVVNLDQYNEQLEKNERLPKIVIIIDELADLMLAAKKEVEDRIQNLTQKARAAGIHLIVATQRPSTDVITGVIKSNLATRIAFYVASEVDSRVILDQSGAQKLLGKGDFLYTTPGLPAPVRVQSAFISPEDSLKVVNFIKNNNEAYYNEEATAYINNTRTSGDDSLFDGGKEDLDPIYIEALRHVILTNSASISMIQRKCSAGYNRAGRIIEWMEEKGYISPFDGAKARKVLITKEEFESQYGPL